MLWLDEKYISLISSRLKHFKRVKAHQYVFRCPICGDSKQNEWKTRGGFYVHPNSQDYNMGCFNCSASMKFSSFLKLTDQNLYNEYVVEKFKEEGSGIKHSPKSIKVPDVEKKRFSVGDIESVESLPDNHPVIEYLNSRKIPTEKHSLLFYAPSYKKFAASLEAYQTDKYSLKTDHPRLIIPFFDKRGNVSRLTARAFSDKETPKYLYTKIDEVASRLYGLDRVDSSKEVFVFEGPLDSLFFENSVAIGSADYAASEIDQFKDKIVIPDNEPRNSAVCANILKAIDKGHRVCLWNEFWGKDVNNMIENNHSIQEITSLIQSSTVQGVEALLKFSKWKRC